MSSPIYGITSSLAPSQETLNAIFAEDPLNASNSPAALNPLRDRLEEIESNISANSAKITNIEEKVDANTEAISKLHVDVSILAENLVFVDDNPSKIDDSIENSVDIVNDGK